MKNEDLHTIVQDPENDRFFQLVEREVSAYSTNPPRKVWSIGLRDYFPYMNNNPNPPDLAYCDGFVYLSGPGSVLKLSAETGEIVAKSETSGLLNPFVPTKSVLMNGRLIRINADGGMEVYSCDDIALLDTESSGLL